MKEWFAVFLVLLTTNFGWIFGGVLGAPIYYVDFLVLPVLLYKVLLNKRIKFVLEDYLLLLYVPLSVVGLLKNYIYDGQSVADGLKAIKYGLLILFYVYFKYSSIDPKKTIKAILNIGFIVSLVVVFASLTKNEYLLEVTYMPFQETFGVARFVLCIPLISYCAIFLFCKYFKTNDTLSLVLFVYYSLVIVFVMQTRSVLMSLPIVIFISYLKLFKYKFYFNVLLVVVVSSVVLFQSLDENSVINTYYMQSKKEVEGGAVYSNSYSARLSSHGYFIDEVLAHPIVGRGKYWVDFYKAHETNKSGYFAQSSDVGLAYVFYRFGILGVLWALVLFYVLLYKCRQVGDDVYLLSLYLFFLFVLFSGVTLDQLTDDKNTVFTFMLIALFLRLYKESRVVGDNKILKHQVLA